MIERFFRRQQSPFPDERLMESYHGALILHEIHEAIGAALEAGPERAQLTDDDLREIIYRASYLLNLQRSPWTEKIADGMVNLAGIEPSRTRRDGRDHFRRGLRDGVADRRRRERLWSRSDTPEPF